MTTFTTSPPLDDSESAWEDLPEVITEQEGEEKKQDEHGSLSIEEEQQKEAPKTGFQASAEEDVPQQSQQQEEEAPDVVIANEDNDDQQDASAQEASPGSVQPETAVVSQPSSVVDDDESLPQQESPQPEESPPTTMPPAATPASTLAPTKNSSTRTRRLPQYRRPWSSAAQNKNSPTKTSHNHRHRPWWQYLLALVRSLLLDVPLVASLALWLAVSGVVRVHETYYRPLLQRARRTDEDLRDEYTYYARSCTEHDISTRNLTQLVIAEKEAVEDTVSTALDVMMRHGGVVFPQLLSNDTVTNLRAYIVQRNADIQEAEVYPMSQGERRLSYGIDATEHPAVTAAVKEAVSNPLLRQTLQRLLGDVDPASAEITAITAFSGAEDQVWHQDTKADGNAIQFARTFSHSYSLFMPLQDTTAAMGPTDVVPGTHYCVNDLENMCEANRMGLNEASSDNVFAAGNAALLNQHVWHRGSAHRDATAPERIIFILSFLARPSTRGVDLRQLSRGTYFHQKWLMWGHTLQDLLQPTRWMRRPWSVLRCLSLYKPAAAHWGYDLITATILRIANEQLEEDDLENRFVSRLDQLHFPTWLRGRVMPLYDDANSITQLEQWSVFVEETMDKAWQWAQTIAFGVHGAYLTLLLLCWIIGIATWTSRSTGSGGGFVLRRVLVRFLVAHGILLVLSAYAWYSIGSSKWGSSIRNGRLFARPFPPIAIPKEEEAVWMSTPLSSNDHDGRIITTLPTRSDVLRGTRYDAKFLGSYDHWLDYHPGNRVFLDSVEARAALYRSYVEPLGSDGFETETIFSRRLVQEVMDTVSIGRGRFLEQDYRTGDWHILTHDVSIDVVKSELVAAGNSMVSGLVRELDHRIAGHRFGPGRGTVLAHLSQLVLWKLRRRLLGLDGTTIDTTDLVVRPASASRQSPAVSSWVPQKFLPQKVQTKSAVSVYPTPYRQFSLPPPEPQDDFQIGTAVSCYYEDDDTWYEGVIVRAHNDSDTFDISFVDDSSDQGLDRSRLKLHQPVTQGQRVVACTAQYDGECFAGTILRVMPSAEVMILYDDGDYEAAVPPGQYFPENPIPEED